MRLASVIGCVTLSERHPALKGCLLYTSLGIADLCKEFGISGATVRRDLAYLEKSRQITRTYGGALADYNHRFPSFRQRRSVGSEGKHVIAKEALRLLRPEMVVYLDAGTTVFILSLIHI